MTLNTASPVRTRTSTFPADWMPDLWEKLDPWASWCAAALAYGQYAIHDSPSPRGRRQGWGRVYFLLHLSGLGRTQKITGHLPSFAADRAPAVF